MNASTHLVFGSALGVATGNPVLGFVAGFLSHSLLDAIPHADQGAFVKGENWNIWVWVSVFIDIFLGSAIILYFMFVSHDPILIFMGAFGGLLTDLLDNVPFWKKQFRRTKFGKFFHSLHDKWHWTVERQNWILGMLNQLIVFGGSLWYLFTKL